MKKYFIIILIIFITVNIFSQDGKIIEALSLTDEQRDSIIDLVVDATTKKEKLSVDLRIKRLELKQILLQEDLPARSEIKSKLKDISEIEIELKLLKYDLDVEILKVLTTDQKKKYKYFRTKKAKELQKDLFKYLYKMKLDK